MGKKKKKKNNPTKRVITAVIATLMVVSIGYFVWEISQEVETTFTLLSDINDAKKELAELQEEQAYLIQQRERLMDEDYLKVWARGEFLILEEGEELYRLPSTGD